MFVLSHEFDTDAMYSKPIAVCYLLRSIWIMFHPSPARCRHEAISWLPSLPRPFFMLNINVHDMQALWWQGPKFCGDALLEVFRLSRQPFQILLQNKQGRRSDSRGLHWYCVNWNATRSNQLLYRFYKGMKGCFITAIWEGFTTIKITPHLDDGLGKGGWRNVLRLNPVQKLEGYSYNDIMLRPLLRALNESIVQTNTTNSTKVCSRM
jgi:hypothetical protein